LDGGALLPNDGHTGPTDEIRRLHSLRFGRIRVNECYRDFSPSNGQSCKQNRVLVDLGRFQLAVSSSSVPPRLLVFSCLVCILLTACGGGGGSSISAPPLPPDFVLGLTPSSISLVPGTSTTVQASVTPQNGFSGTVTLAPGTLPSGISISPTLPQSVGSSGLALTISATSGVAVNSYSLPLTATSGSLQHSATEKLTVANRADFSLGVPLQTVNVAISNSDQLGINVIPGLGVVDYTVSFQASAPTGVSATFSSTTVTPPASSTLTVSVSASASIGPGTVTINATRSLDGQLVASSFPVYIDPKPGTIPGNRTNWVRFGSNPIAVYYDAPRNHVLASLPAINQVEVVDPATGNLLSSIPVSVANFEPNGVWLASSSNLSGSLDGNSVYVMGAGHVATIDLASGQVIRQQATPQAPSAISPTFLVAAMSGHMVFGSWGDSSFYHWDGVSALASVHSISDLYSFDRNFDGSKVLVLSGDTGAGYQLLDIASDTIVVQGNYANAVLMTVRGNPVRGEWAVANSNGIDFLDGNMNLIARVPAVLAGSSTYWGMTYSPDGKYLYFVSSPTGLPFLITIDTSTYQVVNSAPATGTDLAYILREPPEWITQPFAADTTGLVFGLGQKGLVIDDATYTVDPNQATPQDYAIIATPDNGPVNASTPVQITTQVYAAQPDIWFGNERASSESLNTSGQAAGTAPAAQVAGPVNIKLFPPDGYAHVMPQAFAYGTTITSMRNSICPVTGGCSTDIFGFGLFGSDASKTTVKIGGSAASVNSTNYFGLNAGYPYPLQFLTVTVPSGTAGRADVVVTSGAGQATLPGGFLYASSLHSYPSPQIYNALLFDEKRQILYLSTNSQIARFSVSSSNFLSPITPPSLTGQNQFQAMALTPDGSKLIVANETDESVALIDPDDPASAQAVAVPANAGTGGPLFVAATSTGKALISMSDPASGPLYALDLVTLQVVTQTINGGSTAGGERLSGTSDGSTILLRGYGGGGGLWNDAKQQFTPVFQNFAGAGVGSAAGDGNMFGVGEGFIAQDGTSITAASITDELGGFQSWQPNDAALNDSGSLEFAPGQAYVGGPSGLFILDTHHGDVLGNIVLQNQINNWTKTIAVDSVQHVFMADSQGLTVLTLEAAPLAIGWLNPAVASTNGSSVIVVRGSGFQTGTSVTIGGKSAIAIYVDANTLQVTAPANAAGAAQMIVQNPGGEKYVLDAALLYQ
jgi:hypothetical protein